MMVKWMQNKLANEELCQLFGYTRLKSGDVSPNIAKADCNWTPLLSNATLAITKLGFCISEASGKQVLRRLNVIKKVKMNVLFD